MGLSLHSTILGLLAEKPMCAPQIAERAYTHAYAVGKVLARMVGERRLKFCGFGIDAGFSQYANSPMWGLRDAKPFTAVDMEGSRIECPACGSHQTYRTRRFHRVECHTCNINFRDGEKRTRPEVVHRSKNGSGHYAGRITIGRGSRWAWVG